MSFVWLLQSLGPVSSLEWCYSATIWFSCGCGSLFVCLRPSMFTVATMFPGWMFSISFHFMEVCLAPCVPISVCQSVSLCFSVCFFLPFSLSLSLSLSRQQAEVSKRGYALQTEQAASDATSSVCLCYLFFEIPPFSQSTCSEIGFTGFHVRCQPSRRLDWAFCFYVAMVPHAWSVVSPAFHFWFVIFYYLHFKVDERKRKELFSPAVRRIVHREELFRLITYRSSYP